MGQERAVVGGRLADADEHEAAPRPGRIPRTYRWLVPAVLGGGIVLAAIGYMLGVALA